MLYWRLRSQAGIPLNQYRQTLYQNVKVGRCNRTLSYFSHCLAQHYFNARGQLLKLTLHTGIRLLAAQET